MSMLVDGVHAVVKRDCPTCVLVAPILEVLARDGVMTSVASQDDPNFPNGMAVRDDTSLELSYHLDIDTVPTLVRISNGSEVDRTVGWSLQHWAKFLDFDLAARLAALPALSNLPAYRPGCGSKTYDPGVPERLALTFGGSVLRSRRIELAAAEDEAEVMFERGWTDGLPVVAPTPERVMRMLAGTTRAPHEIVAVAPPDLVDCTVEKVAINAVMAGCKPEYLPVVLAAVEAACTTEFNGHGLLATTYFSGPVVIVNGPLAKAIGMNSGVNVLGQGNRANATIGRALQLVIRNVGGGVPGGVDRAALGNPGKYTFCFAEDDDHSPWESLATERGVPPGRSAVTLFAGEGPRGVVDQQSRDPESLARTFATCLRGVGHPKLVLGMDAIVVVGPEHARVFRDAGWSKARLRETVLGQLQIPSEELVRGAGGIAEGIVATVARPGTTLPKFRPNGLWFVQCGGGAGMFSSIIGGWVNGSTGSEMITKEIGT